MHLDVGHAGCPRVGLKVGYCLTDFSVPDSGATWFIRKSHKLSKPLGIREGDVDPPVYDEPLLHAGDAFLFESRIYHAAGAEFQRELSLRSSSTDTTIAGLNRIIIYATTTTPYNQMKHWWKT